MITIKKSVTTKLPAEYLTCQFSLHVFKTGSKHGDSAGQNKKIKTWCFIQIKYLLCIFNSNAVSCLKKRHFPELRADRAQSGTHHGNSTFGIITDCHPTAWHSCTWQLLAGWAKGADRDAHLWHWPLHGQGREGNAAVSSQMHRGPLTGIFFSN